MQISKASAEGGHNPFTVCLDLQHNMTKLQASSRMSRIHQWQDKHREELGAL